MGRVKQEKYTDGTAIVRGAPSLTPKLNLTIMVTLFTETRDYPRYDLRQVHALAAIQKVYLTRSAQRDMRAIRYELDDVCRCLGELKSSNFRHSGRYEDPLWYDVYRIRFTSPTEHVDDLYIKLSLGRGCLVIDLFSFHLTRTI